MRLSRRAKVIISTTLLIAVIVGALLYQSGRGNSDKWVFKGAYSIYIGSGFIRGRKPVSVTVTLKLLIADYNKTHYRLIFQQVFEYGATGESVEDFNDTWINASNPNYYPLKGYRLINETPGRINVRGIGERSVEILTYKSRYNSTVRVYVDDKTRWPLIYEYVDYLGKGSSLIARITSHNIHF